MIPMMIHTTSAPMNRMAISRISATMNPVKSYCRQQIGAARDMLAHGRGARFGRLQPQWLPIAISAVGLLPEQVRNQPNLHPADRSELSQVGADPGPDPGEAQRQPPESLIGGPFDAMAAGPASMALEQSG